MKAKKTTTWPVEIRRGDLLRLFPRAESRFFSPGDAILKEGEPAQACFYLQRGTVRIHKKGRNRTTFDLGLIRQGAFFGEMAMLTGEKRTATATAVGRVEAIELDRRDFELAVRTGHPLAARLALRFAVELAGRSSHLLKLLGRQPKAAPRSRKSSAVPAPSLDIRPVLHKVYSLWAV